MLESFCHVHDIGAVPLLAVSRREGRQAKVRPCDWVVSVISVSGLDGRVDYRTKLGATCCLLRTCQHAQVNLYIDLLIYCVQFVRIERDDPHESKESKDLETFTWRPLLHFSTLLIKKIMT